MHPLTVNMILSELFHPFRIFLSSSTISCNVARKGKKKDTVLFGLCFSVATRRNWPKLLGGRDPRTEVICLKGVMPFASCFSHPSESARNLGNCRSKSNRPLARPVRNVSEELQDSRRELLVVPPPLYWSNR